MIFLKKLFHRPAGSRKKGSITVWLALSFLVFLSLYLICLQSVQKQSAKRRAEQAVENGMFSLFSEYEPHLLDKWDLFYIDTSFRSGTEKREELCSHLWKFIQENITNVWGKPLDGLELQGINLEDLVRATDGEGAVFYQQAIEVMKEKWGQDLVEDWLLRPEQREEMLTQAEEMQRDYEESRRVVMDYDDEDDELSGEASSWSSFLDGFFFKMAVPSGSILSEKVINTANIPSVRTLSEGAGTARGNEDDLIQKQWFIGYTCDYLLQASDCLAEGRTDGYLDYQMEYLFAGQPSDQRNLELTILSLLTLREGANYTFLLTHSNYVKQAELLAMMIAGLTGEEGLIQAVKHLILIGWAYAESIVEVRQLLGGYELAAVKGDDQWQVPLSAVLSLIGNPGRYDVQTAEQSGLDYEDYLRMLLTIVPAKTLAMRSLDVIEGELRMIEGCERIHLDHCVESMTAQVWMDGIYLERTYGYE